MTDDSDKKNLLKELLHWYHNQNIISTHLSAHDYIAFHLANFAQKSPSYARLAQTLAPLDTAATFLANALGQVHFNIIGTHDLSYVSALFNEYLYTIAHHYIPLIQQQITIIQTTQSATRDPIFTALQSLVLQYANTIGFCLQTLQHLMAHKLQMLHMSSPLSPLHSAPQHAPLIE